MRLIKSTLLEHEILIDQSQTNSTPAETSVDTEHKEIANDDKRSEVYASSILTQNDSLVQDSPPIQEAPWQQEWRATSMRRKAGLVQKQQRTHQDEENERCEQNDVLHLDTKRVELQNGILSNAGILC